MKNKTKFVVGLWTGVMVLSFIFSAVYGYYFNPLGITL